MGLDVRTLRPRAIWGVGLNYRGHVAETGRDVPSAPTIFMKSPGSLIGHGDAIVVPPHVLEPDYEGEVALIMGRSGRDIPEDEARDFILGVTCANDVSARDHQYVTGQWVWSKSFDTFCAIGPELVPADLLDLDDLALSTRLNGDVVQAASTSELVFPVARLVSEISRGITLAAGDIILTGTPAGVGSARVPPRFLEDGDVVEVAIEGVGRLRNTVTRA